MVCWKIFNYTFKFRTCNWSVYIYILFFLVQSWKHAFLYISSGGPFCWYTVAYSMSICISVVSIVNFSISSLILFIWVLSMFYLMNLAKVLSVLFISQKNQLLVSLFFSIVFFISVHLLLLWYLWFFFCSTFLCSFSSCFSYNVRLFIWDYFYFLT